MAPTPVYNGSSCDNIVPLAVPAHALESNEDVSPLRRTASVSTLYAWPHPYGMQTVVPHIPAAHSEKRWSELLQDRESNVSTDVSDNELESLPKVPAEEHTPTHSANLSEDEQSSKILATPVALPVEVKKRWADLSEDEQTPVHQKASSTVGRDEQDQNDASEAATDEVIHREPSEDEKPIVMKPPRPARPQFAKPTREARVRQFRAKLDEFFELDFDEVDPSQQDGLTHRMLFGLKSFGELVTFWQEDGTQVNEEGFRLVGLEEADMYALGRVIRKADRFLEERRFREAYDELCEARRWFNADTLMEERAKAAVHTEKRLAKKERKEQKGKKACDSDAEDSDWTQVKSKEKKGSAAVSKKRNADTSQIMWKNDGRKAGQKQESVSKSTSSVAGQNLNSKLPHSNMKPQTSGKRRQAGQARKNPQKMLCRYNVGIEQDRAFNVLRKLLGERGSHMKTIAENTGAKLRIRGRGSGYLEGPDQTEASDEPLMLCISAESREGFEAAVQDVESLLENVHNLYRKFCSDRNLPVPSLSVVQNEQPSR